jgi:hypothetical protein
MKVVLCKSAGWPVWGPDWVSYCEDFCNFTVAKPCFQ